MGVCLPCDRLYGPWHVLILHMGVRSLIGYSPGIQIVQPWRVRKVYLVW